jgi:hypothetical protein
MTTSSNHNNNNSSPPYKLNHNDNTSPPALQAHTTTITTFSTTSQVPIARIIMGFFSKAKESMRKKVSLRKEEPQLKVSGPTNFVHVSHSRSAAELSALLAVVAGENAQSANPNFPLKLGSLDAAEPSVQSEQHSTGGADQGKKITPSIHQERSKSTDIGGTRYEDSNPHFEQSSVARDEPKASEPSKSIGLAVPFPPPPATDDSVMPSSSVLRLEEALGNRKTRQTIKSKVSQFFERFGHSQDKGNRE